MKQNIASPEYPDLGKMDLFWNQFAECRIPKAGIDPAFRRILPSGFPENNAPLFNEDEHYENGFSNG